MANLSRKFLTYVCWAIVLLTPVLRLCLLIYAPHQFSDIHYKTWDLGDFFAAGALLALYIRTGPSRRAVGRLSAGLTVAGAGLTILGWDMDKSQDPLVLALALEPTVIICSGLLLLAFHFPGSAQTLAGRILSFFGAISYGLYLVHQFIINMVIMHVQFVPSDPTTNHMAQMAVAGMVSVAIAFVSRYTFEAFFLRIQWRGKEMRTPFLPQKCETARRMILSSSA